MSASLSKFLPPHTLYFHSFPSGEDSFFYNPVPAWVDELAAARLLTCAGHMIQVLTFASATTPEIVRILRDELKMPICADAQILRLPSSINADLEGAERNEAIKKALSAVSGKHQLIMSQPFLDSKITNRYLIPPEVTIHLNDKLNIQEYVPAEYLPKRYAHFRSGEDFFQSEKALPLPVVIKVASSGAGDGVKIVNSERELHEEKNFFRNVRGDILAEEFVPVKENLCVQFGVPQQEKAAAEIIGINEQFIDARGSFLGGIVRLKQKKIAEIQKVLIGEILPKVRSMGWFGVGGIDVLVSPDGNFYFIDGNFRMNASFPYICMVHNGAVAKSIFHFTATFTGTLAEFRSCISAQARLGTHDQSFVIVNMSRFQDICRLNMGIMFASEEELKINAARALHLGIRAPALETLLDRQ